jgi:DNA-binding NarL/FixJ family response regulator
MRGGSCTEKGGRRLEPDASPLADPDENDENGAMRAGLPRVLCVDDSEDIGELMARALRTRLDLESAGYLSDATRLPEEAVLRSVDVVILDLTLPGTDVFEAIRRLRNARPSCRVLVYSGQEHPTTVRSAMEAGASCFMCKSRAIQEVLDTAKRITADPV